MSQNVTNSQIDQEVAARFEEMVRVRRDLHRHPELAFQEERTAAIIMDKLKAAGIKDIQTGVAKTGVVATLQGAQPGKTLVVRADIDALPIVEEPDSDYKSETAGIMHACGHDGHVAIALAVSSIMAQHRDQIAGTVKFVFQPAEERVSGAKPMIDAGIMQGVDAAIGLHLGNDGKTGKVSMKVGPTMANVDSIRLTIRGKGGHGSQPEKAVDSIAASAYVITTIQTIVSREVAASDTAVITFGTIKGGFASNIIAPEVTLTGTVRSFVPETRQLLLKRIEEVATGVAQAMRCQLVFEIVESCPAVVNNLEITDLVRASASDILGQSNVEEMKPIMGSDDMALFLQAVPGCYFFVGSAPSNGPVFPHHHPSFDIDEQSLAVGARTMARAAFDFLS